VKIEALRLFNVKRFAGRGVAIEGIGDGVNVLSAPNEFGKSTSFEALHALFFLPHSSTSGEVRNLRPYSAGNPLIEADIASASGRIRISKQFYGGRYARVTDIATGRLLAQADEAENYIASLIQGGTAGPAGLLWVRQGTTGIEKRTKSDEDGEKQVRTSLLESVQGEVEAVTGGRRMGAIQQAANKELAELLTPTGRPKAGSRYASALEIRDRLTAEELKLGEEVKALRKALDDRATANRRLTELDSTEDREQRKKATIDAQAALEAAKAQSEALKAVEAKLNLALERRTIADNELKKFRSALGDAALLRDSLIEAERQRSDALAKRGNAAENLRIAKANADAAELEERTARDLLSRLDAAMKARDAALQLDALKERLRKADEIRDLVEKHEAKLAIVKISAKAIDELQTLESEIVGLKAAEEAARPSISISYETQVSTPILMDGAPLLGGEEHSYVGQAQLTVPSVGTITLRSNQPARSDNRLEQAEAKRSALLASMGVNDLAAARKRQTDEQRMQTELSELRVQLATFAPEGLQKLREDVAQRATTDQIDLELKGDPASARTRLTEAEDRRQRTKVALIEAEPMHENATTAYAATAEKLAELNGKSTQLDAILGPEQAREDHERALVKNLDDRNREYESARSDLDALKAVSVDLESAAATLRRARSVEEAANSEMSKLREDIAGLNAEIRTRSDEAVEEKWNETTEALAAASVRVEQFEKEVAVLQRLCAALETARSHARELYLQPVMTELKPLLGLLFDDVSITFDEKSLLPDKILRNGQEEDVERLSGGMREQLSILTRLAFARLLARDGRPAPVILDDALVYSDDDRIEKMFDALHRQSADQQIIVFSCRQRAFQKLGGNVLHMTDWQPETA